MILSRSKYVLLFCICCAGCKTKKWGRVLRILPWRTTTRRLSLLPFFFVARRRSLQLSPRPGACEASEDFLLLLKGGHRLVPVEKLGFLSISRTEGSVYLIDGEVFTHPPTHLLEPLLSGFSFFISGAGSNLRRWRRIKQLVFVSVLPRTYLADRRVVIIVVGCLPSRGVKKRWPGRRGEETGEW
ncbi:hypothetical protein CPC08DRAFT_273994 [Agrocybe pediades]|nr:hypothetical protein CPC08DRAFT_273994 [Agrocybe pediades]